MKQETISGRSEENLLKKETIGQEDEMKPPALEPKS